MDPWDVRRHLLSPGWRLVCLDQVGSTNDVARRAGDMGLAERLAVFAELQTAGRGRMGRSWQAPRGLGVTCSTLWRVATISPLWQVAGVAVVRALARFAVAARLKWPNDVMVVGRKCGGILIEGVLEGVQPCYAVLGIGLNVLQGDADLPPTSYPATSVYLATGRRIDRVALAAALLDELAERATAGSVAVFGQWRAAIETIGREVDVVAPDGVFSGRAIDVEPDGALLVRRTDGEVTRLVSGEVSVRG